MSGSYLADFPRLIASSAWRLAVANHCQQGMQQFGNNHPCKLGGADPGRGGQQHTLALRCLVFILL